MYRHGDVLLVPSQQIPAGLTLDTLVVAEGELTGHAHRIQGQGQLIQSDQSLFLKVDGEATLTHEEHGPIPLARGLYEVIQQREFAPWLQHRRQTLPLNPLEEPSLRERTRRDLQELGGGLADLARPVTSPLWTVVTVLAKD